MPDQNESLKYISHCSCWLPQLKKVGGKAETENQMMAILNIARADVHQKYAEKKELLNIQALVNGLHVNAALS